MATFQYLDEGNSEAQDRLATSFLLAQTSAGLATTGVLSGLAVTQTTTASGAVLIAAGAAPVQASVGTGVALLVNDTQATLDVFTSEPMGGLPRNDIVAFDSVTKALIFIKGTPNATPDDPTVPDTACALARLRHAASATTIPTAKIDDLRVATGMRGALISVDSQAERDALTAFATAENPIVVVLAGVLWICNDATTWRTVGVSTLPHLRIKQASAQSRPGASWGQVAFGTTADTSGSQPWTEATGGITLTSAGLYNIELTVSMTSAAFAVKLLNWTASATLAQGQLGAGASFSASVSTTRRLAAGVLLLAQVYPTSTMNVAADSDVTPTFMSITKLSD